ncbi:hypothetical protein GCM10011575_48210 [Microlunatus endophyticus]|uniref:Aminoglycoside phosphotransferase domain-containing protein n=1 Tax=Microlunatus endophyticus TaxID=1716077 RepID=A0A917SKP5_9ACTN|nr:aminoglycoside phosphotransferase family protein [Microlunatus endophyticus]GGL84307.1 hypothetical protein GCM10011575_48210 [Microlunatus endophyticus]
MLVEANRILEGYSNEVYRVRCADGQDVVVRVLRFDHDVSSTAAAGEAAAIEKARAAGAPGPEILLLDTVRIDDVEFPVMVQRAVAGRPLGEVIDRLSERQRNDVLAEIGSLIARISQVPVDGRCDWPTAMAAELAHLYAARDKILAGGFEASEFDRIMDLLEGYVVDFPCEQWVLCHGDLSLKHIFVTTDDIDDAARVSGIIDFGDWTPGAPVHDLAVLRAREPRLDLAPLLAGYGAPADHGFRRRLDLHTLIIALGSLAFGVEEGDQACIVRSAQQIRILVRDLPDT